ncbi:MAG: lipoyl(octanoyl) transferase LipB [Actinobacteria bacterium]|nr:lipoyl(octanoyl) transferase LipB [Actinomycetota bacterium]
MLRGLPGGVLYYKDLGTVSYSDAYNLQLELFDLINESSHHGIILLLEHPPVITLGSNRSISNLISTAGELEACGIELVQSTRGGDITIHAPGQIVCYPVINLAYFKKDLTAYVSMLEEVIIEVLKFFGVKGKRVEKHRGVYVDRFKIASIGLKVKKWVSLHGFSLNVSVDPGLFSHIISCGLREYPQISLNELPGSNIPLDDVKEQIIKKFEKIFKIPLINIGT